MQRLIRTRCLLAVLSAIASVVHGVAISPRGSDGRADSDSFGHDQESNSSFYLTARQGPDPPEWLRILPLGASIVRGWGPDGVQTDGFRKPLRDRLREDGYNVNMVGSQTYTGCMLDSNHEGYPGHRVDQTIDDVDATAGMRPNIVLINTGTNDAQQNYDEMLGTMDNLKQLVKKVQVMHPQTTIVLSTILMTTNEDANIRVDGFNQQIRKYMYDQADNGYPDGKVILAEMNDGYYITESHMEEDGIHPNEEGCRRMAAVWNKAISDTINLRHWVTEPQDNGIPDDGSSNSDCKKTPGKADGPHQTQKGYGLDDGPYKHTGTKVDTSGKSVLQFPGEDAWKRILFAQIVNAGGNPDPRGVIDDMVWWRSEGGKVKVDYYTNHGDGVFDYPYYTVDKPFDCPSEDVRFADINGDGMDDFLCIESNGNVRAAVNTGSGTTVSFREAGIHREAGLGWQNRHVRIGDIDGDGRADYCLIGDDGSTNCWRNGGLGDTADYWQDIGMTFAPKGKGDIKGTRFLDLNGDFRADWVWVGDKGDTDIYTNKRGPGPNEDRYGLVPYWQHAESSHPGMGVEGARNRVHFARLLVKDGSGRRDYAYITTLMQNPVVSEHWFFEINIWRNDGEGGTQSKSDFDRYCDVDGDGKDDYLQIRPNGDIELWMNIGSPPEWGQKGVIQNIGAVDPKSVLFVKWAGGDHCELLVVNRGTGEVPIRYDEGGADKVQWGFQIPLDPEYRCDQGWGVGLFDMAESFADIDGDGRADYLCMAKDGTTFAVLNGHNGPRDLGQIKFSENKDRANHRFADVNGDGKADFLWVDKFSGEVQVWYNQGVRDSRPENGSMVQWDPQGVLYSGVDRGSNEYFLDYDGDKRADIVRVDPITNWAEILYNSCPGGTGGDDSESNPNLPQYPPEPPPLTCPLESRPCKLNPFLCPDDLEDKYDAPVGEAGIKRRRQMDLQPRTRKDREPKYWELVGGALAILRYVPYPGGAETYLSRWQPFGRLALLRYILYNWGSCDVATDPTIEVVDVDLDQNGQPIVPPSGDNGNAILLHSDHVWDRGQLQRFIDDAVRGVLSSGSTENLPPNPLSGAFFEAGTGLWDRTFPALTNLGSVGFNGQGPIGDDRGRGSSRVAESAESENNMFPMVMLDEDLNLVKGRIMQNYEPWRIEETEDNQTPIRDLARAGARNLNQQLINDALAQLRLVFAVFDCLNSPDVSPRFLRVNADQERELQNLENAAFQTWRLEHPTAPNQDIVLWWRRWIEDRNALIGSNAREWVNRAVEAVRICASPAERRGSASCFAAHSYVGDSRGHGFGYCSRRYDTAGGYATFERKMIWRVDAESGVAEPFSTGLLGFGRTMLG